MGTFRPFVEDDGLAFEAIECTGCIALRGEIRCQGGIVISVEKRLAVDANDETDRTALVQTVEYSCNVRLQGVGNVVRYDSAHPDHNADHHVHRYDIFRADREGTTTMHGEAEWPTLGEVIAEARDWYWEHHDEVAKLRRDEEGL